MSELPGSADDLARRAISACGLCRIVVAGAAVEPLVQSLRTAGGLEVHAVSGAAALPTGEWHVILFEAAQGERDGSESGASICGDSLFETCYVRGARSLHLFVEADGSRDGGRAEWEKQAFAAGFRKHPRYYRVATYAELDRPGEWLELLFERMPEQALERYPLAVLQANRQLHMDMLRESGRRGDAHVVRYHMAAELIRPGDVVLDLACGYGYGSYVLFHNSQAKSVLGIDLEPAAIEYAQCSYAISAGLQYQVGDAQRLEALADNSVDFIASFETIEHLPEPARYLDALRRVLRPSGRVMLCAPNDWSDESGEDPNPHHLHVYTWDRLRREVGERFVLERGFVQVAGGAMKCHHSPRDWAEVALEPLTCEAEWILVVGIASPIAKPDVPYVETVWEIPAAHDDFHVSAFERDYANPWLVHAMVTRGTRVTNPQRLREMQNAVLESAAPDSVDYGAALCGSVYALLADGVGSGNSELLQERAASYLAIETPLPHQLRWQVSLWFAVAELRLREGDREGALMRFQRCAELDPSPYSPLLGNKTLDARFRLAQMAVADGDLVTAREQLLRSVAQGQELASGSWRNVIGDRERPLPFGPAELAQLLDRVARAAYALRELGQANHRPGVYAGEAVGYYERILGHRDERIAALERGRDATAGRIADLEGSLRSLSKEVSVREARGHELAAEVSDHDRVAQELATRVRGYQEAEQFWLSKQREAEERSNALERELEQERARTWFDRLFRKRGRGPTGRS